MSTAGHSLMGISDLFLSSWNRFQKAFLNMLFLALIGVGVMLAFALVAFGFGALVSFASGMRNLLLGVFIVLMILGNFLAMIWVVLGWIFLVFNENATLPQAMKFAMEKFGTYLWVALLAALAILGGAILLIVPGVIVAVWFFFSGFVVVDQGASGVTALVKSRMLVSGRWWPVFGRLLLLWLLSGIILSIPIVGQILFIAVLPFSYIYWGEMYKDLKSKSTAG